MRNVKPLLSLLLLTLCVALTACTASIQTSASNISLDSIPAYSGEPYVVINGNQPFFDDSELTTTSFESYSELDALNRCGVAMANVSPDTMPTEDRGNIGQVKPTGWQTVKYD